MKHEVQHVCSWEAALFFREPRSQGLFTPDEHSAAVNTVSAGNPTLGTTTLHPSQRTGCSHLVTDSAPLEAGNVHEAPTSLNGFCTYRNRQCSRSADLSARILHVSEPAMFTKRRPLCTHSAPLEAGNVHEAPTSLHGFCTSRSRQCSPSADLSARILHLSEPAMFIERRHLDRTPSTQTYS